MRTPRARHRAAKSARNAGAAARGMIQSELLGNSDPFFFPGMFDQNRRRRKSSDALTMVGGKREREESFGEKSCGSSSVSSKMGRSGAGGQLVFECTLCGKACSQPSKLTEHMRTHSGDRPYACVIK